MRIIVNPITGKLDMAGEDISSVENASFYSSTTPTSEAHGGIDKGETFDNVPISTVLDRILHKPQPPKISDVYTSPVANSIYELGASVATTLYCEYTSGTSNVVKVQLYQGSTIINTWEMNSTSGQVSHSLTINKSATYKFVVTASDGRTANSSLSYSFVRPIYYGLVSADAVPSSVSGLSKWLPTATSGTYEAKYAAFDNKRFVLALYGTVSKALNPSLFDITKSLSSTSVQLTCLDGQELTYTLYYSEPNTQSKAYPVKYTFSLKK